MKKDYVFPKMKVVKLNIKDDLMIDGGGTTSDFFAKPNTADMTPVEETANGDAADAPKSVWDD